MMKKIIAILYLAIGETFIIMVVASTDIINTLAFGAIGLIVTYMGADILDTHSCE